MTESREIMLDGDTFTVSQLGAMKALKTLNRIGRVLGPALAKAAGGLKTGDLANAELSSLADAVTVLFEKLTDDELEYLTRTLLETATVNGTLLMPVFEIKMRGKMGSVLKLLRFAFEVNYGNFFEGLRGFIVPGTVGSPPPSESPKTLKTAGLAGV